MLEGCTLGIDPLGHAINGAQEAGALIACEFASGSSTQDGAWGGGGGTLNPALTSEP